MMPVIMMVIILMTLTTMFLHLKLVHQFQIMIPGPSLQEGLDCQSKDKPHVISQAPSCKQMMMNLFT